MRKSRTYGSVRGTPGNRRSYRDPITLLPPQMSQYPDIEICSMGSDNTWLRIRGRIAFDDSLDAKSQAFAESPNLKNMYKKGPDDETFVTFYFTEAAATLYSFTEAPKKVPLL
ncbi:MAG: hypothetical protein ABSB94_20590 [Syntrophorhabdales bacterium]